MIHYRHCDISEPAIQAIIKEYMFTTHPRVHREYSISYDVEQMFIDDITHPDKYLPPTGALMCAELNDTVIAVGGLSRINETDAEIKRFYVAENHRGKGIASQMLETLLGDATNLGFKSIKLESARFMTEAHGLYRKYGFEESTLYPEACSEPGFEHAIIFMEKTL